jgi:hypothetical protein
MRAAHTVAADFRLVGRSTNAGKLDNATWDRCRRVLGDDHPDTLTSALIGVAADLSAQGRAVDAVAMRRRWLPTLRARLGVDHSMVLVAERLHAGALRETGRTEEALRLAAHVARRRRLAYREDDLETLAALVTRCLVLAAGEDLVEARSVGEQALDGYHRLVGVARPLAYIAMSDLAFVLDRASEHRRALGLADAAYQGLVESGQIGADHPVAVAAAVNLSATLIANADHRRAVPLLATTLPRARRVLGDDHPDTLACAANLALELSATGDAAGARELRDDTLRHARQSLPPAHPLLRDVAASRRTWCAIDPPPLLPRL